MASGGHTSIAPRRPRVPVPAGPPDSAGAPERDRPTGEVAGHPEAAISTATTASTTAGL
jgi:hypothetical protein